MAKITIEEALQLGIKAHKQGQFQQADRYYNAILKSQPNHPDANHNTGVLAVGAGKVQEALPFFEKAVNFNPKIKQYWISYIETLMLLNKTDEAKEALVRAKSLGLEEDNFRRFSNQLNDRRLNKTSKADPPQQRIEEILALFDSKNFENVLSKSIELMETHPSSTILYELCAASNMNLHRYEAAKNYYEGLLKIQPDAASILLNLGNACNELGCSAEAVSYYDKSIKFETNVAEAYNQKGLIEFNQFKNLKKAKECFNHALAHEPENYLSLFHLGNLHKNSGEFEEAIQNYISAIRINENFIEANNNLAVLYKETGSYDKGIATLTDALKVNPKHPETHNNLGTIYLISNPSKAIEHFKLATQAAPNYADAYCNLGLALGAIGDQKEAILALNKAIEINPNIGSMHYNLSQLQSYKTSNSHFNQMLSLENKLSHRLDDLCHLKFSLAKAFEDQKDFKTAFEYYLEANSLRQKLLEYDIRHDKKIFGNMTAQSSIIKSNSKETMNSADMINKPIFIVGMPRSGTTLIEQILSSHDKVVGGGERSDIYRFAIQTLNKKRKFDIESILDFRKTYLEKSEKLSPGSDYITDKMPQNFLFIPIIFAAFPEAQVVHVRRSAAATCWSNFRTQFASPGLGYSFSLENIKKYYEMYQNLMNEWSAQYYDKIIEVNYEHLTVNPIPTIQELLENLGLPWDEKCMHPEQNSRAVATASQQQVRKKIYKNSSQKWKNYKPFLGGVFDNL